MNLRISLVLLLTSFISLASAQNQLLYQSKAYSIYPDKIVQDKFTAKAVSAIELQSDYRSSEAERYSPTVNFKFSINCRDNEMLSGKDHSVTLCPVNSKCVTNVVFGRQLIDKKPVSKNQNLPTNTYSLVRLDMRQVFNSFKAKGYYRFFNGEKLDQSDFKGVYIAGSSLPLIWDFNNLLSHPELELKDPDGDGIFETTLVMNPKDGGKKIDSAWKLTKNTSDFPQYRSPYPISDAIYNLSTEEMIKAVEPDSTFRTGKEWSGVWTRDISYSIILSMAYLQPKVSEYSLMRKVKNNRIIQDTGTGGAYPASTDRMIWATAAWELYKATGNMNWLRKAYEIVKNSIEDDQQNAFDPFTGMMKGESSFLDWREQTYPLWMQPADIYESECLGTNAVHYQANHVLAQMALVLNDQPTAEKHLKIAETIKNGINKHLWIKEKGYYGQYLYGRNYKIVSPRSEALGEALCVLFGIADAVQSQSIISKVPVMNYGISCIYPQIPGIPPYHNNAVWAFVQSYWAMASAKAGNETSVLESIAAIYRPTGMFLTDKENFVAETGDFAGTQINSDNMLWSLSGSLALVHKVMFGICFDTDSLRFRPFIPKSFDGTRTLTNFKCRNALLDIDLQGYGNKIRGFELDGKLLAEPAVPYTLSGRHSIKIRLSNEDSKYQPINKTTNYITLETPVLQNKSGLLSWSKVKGAVAYQILRNREKIGTISKTMYRVQEGKFAEYQVVAVDAHQIQSFASEPIIVASKTVVQQFEVENYVADSKGKVFAEIGKNINKSIIIPVKSAQTSTYAVLFRYSNGNGPINTENKCAIRTLKVDGKFCGTVILPQRGTNEWSNWGNTNSLQIKLTKGEHHIELIFEPQNENMNGIVNQALLDKMLIYKL